MRISDMDTERAFACMVRLIPYVAAIARDGEIVSMKKELNGRDDLAMGEVIERVMPLILKKHRENVYGILSVLEDKSPEEIRKQPYRDTRAAIKSDLTEEFFDFLPFACRLALTA